MLKCEHGSRAKIHSFENHKFCDECWAKFLKQHVDDLPNWTYADEVALRKQHAKEDAHERAHEAKQMRSLLSKASETVSTDASGNVVVTKKTKGTRSGSILSEIDPLLFKGENTVKEIAELVAKKMNLKGKNLVTNVHVRINNLKKKGYAVTKGSTGKVLVKK
jgi:hypothetical protein